MRQYLITNNLPFVPWNSMQPQLSNYKNKMLKREKKTAGYVVEIYCKDHHKRSGELCADCAEFKEYVFIHLEICPFQEKKGACGRCLLCYSPDFKEKVMVVIGYAGPKMLYTTLV